MKGHDKRAFVNLFELTNGMGPIARPQPKSKMRRETHQGQQGREAREANAVKPAREVFEARGARINKLTQKFVQTGGRNHQGVTTVFHRGGGNKKLYRIIDFKRSLFNHPALVKKIEYDPNRTSYIALVSYRNGMISYILAPKNLSVGDQICAGPTAEIMVGSALPVSRVPVGTPIHNIELKPGRGGQLMRAAGTYAKIIKKDQNNVIIRLNSGKLYSIPSQSMATVGEVASGGLAPGDGTECRLRPALTKAGQSRWKNRRPVVRGVAMNPVDHPHGGGEGRSKGGRHPVSPWGKLTKGKPTRKGRARFKTKRGLA